MYKARRESLRGCLTTFKRASAVDVCFAFLLDISSEAAEAAVVCVTVHTPHHVKITDFGLAKLVSGDESFQSESCKVRQFGSLLILFF